MTRAAETLLCVVGHDAARQVRAFLTECRERSLVQPHQNTLIVLVRICEGHSSADRDRINICYELHRRLAASLAQYVLKSYPELTSGERKAGENQELCEVAPRDIVVLRQVDWKVVAPAWLLGRRFSIRRYGSSFAI
jgi:hypothetical protein